MDGSFGKVHPTLFPVLSPLPPPSSIILTGCGINWVSAGVMWTHCFGRPSFRITRESREVRSSVPESPSSCLHLSVSLFFKVRCNKITTAGIINELEWVGREELISYLWDANQLATSLTDLLMIFSGPQAIPSPSLSSPVPVSHSRSHLANLLPPLCEPPILAFLS